MNWERQIPIDGVQTAIFGVDDLDICDKFFTHARPQRPLDCISFGVENLDELLAGANDMQRKRWKTSSASAVIASRRRCISTSSRRRA